MTQVKFETNKGPILIELFDADAPASAANFLSYVDNGFFDNTIFHRVIPEFVIQGGGFTPDMNQKPVNPPISNEAGNGLKNARGTLSMARTSDPDSATSQFFINLRDNAGLDKTEGNPGYAVFGKVLEGMETVDAIAEVETGSRGFHEDVPVEPVTVEKAERA